MLRRLVQAVAAAIGMAHPVLYGQGELVTTEPLVVSVKVSGVLASQQAHPVKVEMQSGIAPKIEWCVKHGQAVAAGDLLLKLETKELDDAITDAESNLRVSRLALQQAQRSLTALEKSTPLEQAAAQQAFEVAQEAWDYFQNVGKDATISDWKQSVLQSQHSVEYAKEELDQLEKMYKADDLTEESEEIVLTRARNDLASAEHYHRRTQRDAKRALEIELPRSERSLREAAERARIQYEKQKPAAEEALAKAQTELEQQRVALSRQEKKLADLLKDREQCEMKSPAAGVVYHGYERKGIWKTDHLDAGLEKGSKLPLGNIQMTVLPPGSLILLASLPEEELWQLKSSAVGILTPKGAPREKLRCRVLDIQSAPGSSGAFDMRILVDGSADAIPLTAGMHADAEFTVYSSESAIMAPASLVYTDMLRSGERYVWLTAAHGKAERHEVRVGYTQGDRLQILEGLVEGDILLSREKAKELNAKMAKEPNAAEKAAAPEPATPADPAQTPDNGLTQEKSPKE